jgi:hypothetical protein
VFVLNRERYDELSEMEDNVGVVLVLGFDVTCVWKGLSGY